MSRNFADLERELIEDLAPRTGRTLADWMTAIDAAGLVEKNAIIDWLRPQGFSFANASWLERIHNNGGRPIYLDRSAHARPPPERIAPTQRATQPGSIAVVRPEPAPLAAQPTAGRAQPRTEPAPEPDPGRVAELLARGKAYRPLAEMLIRELRRTLADVQVVASGELIGFERPRRLAVLHVGAKELRFALDLGDAPFSEELVAARLPGGGREFSHMVVLTDARQIGPGLMALAKSADLRANPAPPMVEEHH